MKITQADNQLIIDSPIISNFLNDPSKYFSINLIADINCCPPITNSYSPSLIYDPNNTFYIDTATNLVYVNPSAFGLSTLSDGVYRCNLRFLFADNSGSEYDISCIFVDINIKCTLSNYLEGLIAGEDTSSIAYLLHYALTNGSNCGCNCDELCEVFNALNEIITDTTTQTNDCGC